MKHKIRVNSGAIALLLSLLISACGGGGNSQTSLSTDTTSNSSNSSSTTSPVTTSTFVLSSAEVGADGALSSDVTCDGSGSSPSLTWQNPPTGTQSFALLMSTDPGDGVLKYNWVNYNLPGTLTSLSKIRYGWAPTASVVMAQRWPTSHLVHKVLA